MTMPQKKSLRSKLLRGSLLGSCLVVPVPFIILCEVSPDFLRTLSKDFVYQSHNMMVSLSGIICPVPSFSPRVMMKGSVTNGSSECGHNRFLDRFFLIRED